jgi:hypothetical protein
MSDQPDEEYVPLSGMTDDELAEALEEAVSPTEDLLARIDEVLDEHDWGSR